MCSFYFLILHHYMDMTNRKPFSLNLICLYFSYSINILAVIISCMSLPV